MYPKPPWHSSASARCWGARLQVQYLRTGAATRRLNISASPSPAWAASLARARRRRRRSRPPTPAPGRRARPSSAGWSISAAPKAWRWVAQWMASAVPSRMTAVEPSTQSWRVPPIMAMMARTPCPCSPTSAPAGVGEDHLGGGVGAVAELGLEPVEMEPVGPAVLVEPRDEASDMPGLGPGQGEEGVGLHRRDKPLAAADRTPVLASGQRDRHGARPRSRSRRCARSAPCRSARRASAGRELARVVAPE